ncbi:MAG: AbrB/MazE/SpoVT family DNA-binding domain-containing protein [Calditrichaeota bacterium]|nr:AbrB/MazE/SpoVT family DNA-binding domain-containing protein [Calditrichota bacterium]
MKITRKGQVTIPAYIRDRLGLRPESEVDFVMEDDRVYIVKKKDSKKSKRFRKFRGVASVKMSTDEIMALTRRK